MDKVTLTIPAFATPRADGSPGHDIDYFCPWCEVIHSHGNGDDIAVGRIENDAARCSECSGSPHAGHGVNLKIARLVDDVEVIDPRSQWRRNQPPLYRVLYLLRERLMPITIGKLLKVEIGDPIGNPPVIHHFDQIDLSVDLFGRWHATHHYTMIAPTDFRNIESRGYDLLSLMAAFGDLDIAEVAYAVVSFFAPDLVVDTHDFCQVFEAWEKWRCIRRPDWDGKSAGKLDLKAALRENGPNLPAYEDKDWSDVLTNILRTVVPVIARATLPDDVADVTDGPDLVNVLRLVYGLSKGMVLLRLLENISGASLDEGCALAFVAVIDGGDSIADDGAGSPPAISPTSTAVTRMLTAATTAKPVNDNPTAARVVEIGGDA